MDDNKTPTSVKIAASVCLVLLVVTVTMIILDKDIRAMMLITSASWLAMMVTLYRKGMF